MTAEKVLKAIRKIRKFCAEQSIEMCSNCPIQGDCDTYFNGIPETWILEEDEITLVKRGRHNGTDDNH